MSIELTFLPRRAEIVDEHHLVFYGDGWAIGRCDLHEDQDEPCVGWDNVDLPGNLYCAITQGWPAFVRVRPETFRAFEPRVITDSSYEEVFFDSADDLSSLFKELPALRDAAERRSFLADMARWEKECDRISDANPDATNDDFPPKPVFEPARAAWTAWQGALAEWEALMRALDVELGERRREGRPAFNDDQKTRVDALSIKIQKLASAYFVEVPVDKSEPKSQDAIDRQKLYGPPANSLTSGTAYAIACIAARQI